MAAPKGTIPPNAGKGRPAGVPNKATATVREAIAQLAEKNIRRVAPVEISQLPKDSLRISYRSAANLYPEARTRLVPKEVANSSHYTVSRQLARKFRKHKTVFMKLISIKENNMKRYMLVGPAVVLGVLASLALSLHVGLAKGQARAAPAALNGETVSGVAAPAVTLANATRGVVFRTAAINADGTVASCFGCTSSARLSTGVYQVAFNSNSQATNGWSRWVQVDTLSTGSIDGIHCTTADRAGNISAVWVACVDNSGTSADTSFFLFMAR